MCLGGIPHPFYSILKGMRFSWQLLEKNNDKKWNYLSLSEIQKFAVLAWLRREVSQSSKKTIYETRIVKAYIEIKRKVLMGSVYEPQCWKNEEITQISVQPNKTSYLVVLKQA